MPVTGQQLAAYAERHAMTIPFDTSPRCLAGPGDARHVTHALAAADWTALSDPLSTEVLLAGPGRQHTLAIDPQSKGASWQLIGNPPGGKTPSWHAEFGRMIPAEILAGMTDALAAPTAEEAPGLQTVLAGAGWTWTQRDDGTRQAHSPDQLVRVFQQPLDAGYFDYFVWRVEASGTPREGPPVWHAWIMDSTPAALVAGFAAALATTEPVQRALDDHTGHHTVTQERSDLTPEQVVEAHTTRLHTIRSQALAARRRTRASPAPAPASPHTVATRSR
ncbi:DUF317 domain-containing protein [Streptomyces sp. NPDC050161]|uniref:DUF317 domain-containing protein n=1 Tax=Streptomyces sp. NPDC050161 TaxID=3365604 RepID=UPI00378C13F2